MKERAGLEAEKSSWIGLEPRRFLLSVPFADVDIQSDSWGRSQGCFNSRSRWLLKACYWFRVVGQTVFFGESREKQDWHPTNRQRQHGKDGVWLGLRELTPGSDSDPDSESAPPARQRVLCPAGAS